MPQPRRHLQLPRPCWKEQPVCFDHLVLVPAIAVGMGRRQAITNQIKYDRTHFLYADSFGLLFRLLLLQDYPTNNYSTLVS